MENYPAFIWVKESIYSTKVGVHNILYCQICNNHLIIHRKNEKDLIVSNNLCELEKMLPADQFCHCSRSCILNIDEVIQYSEKNLEAILNGNIPLSVGRSYKSEFENRLFSRNYLP
jgi:DNA-binding LytR/AlgR family response regulator